MTRTTTVTSSLILLGGVLFVALRGAGPVPPLGPFLDPVHGAWAAARFAELPAAASEAVPGLTGTVEVKYDRRGVPHIYATTEEDAIRALGFVVARDRLFQLDLQARAASGRLTEWVGAQAISLDREMRRLGLTRAAELKFAALPKDGLAQRLVDSYAQGVNAWIDGMPRDAVPLEYRLLNVKPTRWQPINSIHMLNRMGWTLAYFRSELSRLDAASLVGVDAANALFPLASPIQEPIQPNGQRAPRFDWNVLPPPGLPAAGDAVAAGAPQRLTQHFSVVADGALDDGEPRRGFASNNWAVAPGRTSGGHALLAGDPHLELTLPSIWYEAHLVVPGTLDVYGVTIPGLPGIVIGFNRDVAWSFTNTMADVLDFYAETVDDSLHPTKYLLDGAWKSIEQRVEEYRGKNGAVVGTDTLYFTHRGPMTRQQGRWLSMRWTVLDPSQESVALVEATHARSTREFLDATARTYYAPAQNMITADRTGSIAIRSTGRYPIRPDTFDGLQIRDGSKSASDWQGWWPVDKYPQAMNPAQGYLASANQQPIDPRQAFAYVADDASFDPWRALRINHLLRGDSAMTADKMRQFQTDPGSERAELLVPFFIAAGARRSTGAAGASRDSAAAILRAWDRKYTRENQAAVLLEASMRQLVGRTWDELRRDGKRVATPSAAMLLNLMQDSASAWWDSKATATSVEHRDDILAESMASAYDSLVTAYGPHSAGGWRWSKVGPASMRHLLGLPGFSVLGVPIQGGAGTLNPSSAGPYGSSWRMVVELGPTVTAMGTYPGGQSGNPASARYDDRIPFWRDGRLDTLFTPARPQDLTGSGVRAAVTLRPAEGKR